MRTALMIAILGMCLCSPMTFAAGSFYTAGNPRTITTTLDTSSAGSDPIGVIINAINKMDAWFQRHLW